MEENTLKSVCQSVIVLTAVLWGAVCAWARVPPEGRPAWLPEVGPYMQRAAASGFQGSLVIADRQGTTLFEKAYGKADRDAGTPFTLDTAVNIGSTRKAYVAAIIMSLADEGILAVDAPISRYLPAVPTDKAAITLHQLMTHTAGLPDDEGGPMKRLGRDALMRQILETKLLFPPGTDFSYSDTGYALLQVIAERVSDTTFRNLVRLRIVKPLDLQHTGFLDDPVWTFNNGRVPVAHGYVNGKHDKTSARHRPRTGWSPLGAGLVLSTPRDAVTWLQGLLEGRAVSPMAVKQIFTRHVSRLENEVWYGYGWFIIDNEERGRVFGHGGATISHNFYVSYLKDAELFISAASNRIDVMRKDVNGDGDMTDKGETSEIFYAAQIVGGLTEAIHQHDFTIVPGFMQTMERHEPTDD